MDPEEKAFQEALQSESLSEEGQPEEKDKPEDKTEKVEAEEKVVEEPKEDPEEEKVKVKFPAPVSKYPDVKDGDYEKGADDVYVINAEHLAVDVKDILEKDAGIFSKIYKAKPEKGEVIATILGVKGDDTRSPGKVMDDVVRAMKSGDAEANKKLLATHFPFLIDQNLPLPFSFSQSIKFTEAQAPSLEKDPVVDLQTAAYRISAEVKGAVSAEEILADKAVIAAMENYKYDVKTGKPISAYDAMVLALNELYGDVEEEDPDAPDPSGGVRGNSGKDLNGAQSAKEIELERALSSFK